MSLDEGPKLLNLVIDALRVTDRADKSPVRSGEQIPTDIAGIEVAVDQISPNPYQPRKVFNEASIEELTRSDGELGTKPLDGE